MDDLILENTKLIHKVIKDLHVKYSSDDEYQDYYDAGLIGLIEAAKKYDSSKSKPSSFFYPSIANKIKHVFILKTAKKRCNEYGKDISLHSSISIEDNETELLDLVEDKTINIENDFLEKMKIEKLYLALKKSLSEREYKLICQKYGLLGYKNYSYKELEEQEHCSHQNIGIILNRAKRKIKKYMESEGKEAFMLEDKQSKTENIKINRSCNNTLSKVNEYLFNQLSALNDNSKDIEMEIKKSHAIVQLAQGITNNFNTCIKAVKLANEVDESKGNNVMSFIGINER